MWTGIGVDGRRRTQKNIEEDIHMQTDSEACRRKETNENRRTEGKGERKMQRESDGGDERK